MRSLGGYCLPDGLEKGDSERGETIEYGDADVKFSDLTVEVPRSHALAQKFDTVHFRLDTAPPMITAPPPPDDPSEAFRSLKGFIPGDGSQMTWGSTVLRSSEVE